MHINRKLNIANGALGYIFIKYNAKGKRESGENPERTRHCI